MGVTAAAAAERAAGTVPLATPSSWRHRRTLGWVGWAGTPKVGHHWERGACEVGPVRHGGVGVGARDARRGGRQLRSWWSGRPLALATRRWGEVTERVSVRVGVMMMVKVIAVVAAAVTGTGTRRVHYHVYGHGHGHGHVYGHARAPSHPLRHFHHPASSCDAPRRPQGELRQTRRPGWDVVVASRCRRWRRHHGFPDGGAGGYLQQWTTKAGEAEG